VTAKCECRLIQFKGETAAIFQFLIISASQSCRKEIVFSIFFFLYFINDISHFECEIFSKIIEINKKYVKSFVFIKRETLACEGQSENISLNNHRFACYKSILDL
jgi:hypothetical protein